MFDIRDMTQQQLPWTGLSIWLVQTQMCRLKFMKKWTSYLVSPLQHILEDMQLWKLRIFLPLLLDKIQHNIWFVIGGSDRPASMNDLKEMRYLECCIKVKYIKNRLYSTATELWDFHLPSSFSVFTVMEVYAYPGKNDHFVLVLYGKGVAI